MKTSAIVNSTFCALVALSASLGTSFATQYSIARVPENGVIVAAASRAQQNVVPSVPLDQIVNGGFESGNFAPWVLNDPSGFSNIGTDSAFAHSGTFHANLGAVGAIGTLTQTFSTIAGQQYNLSYWLANDSGVQPNSFAVFFNNVQIASLTITNSAVFDYTNFMATITASGTSSTLQFRYRHDDDFFRLDDVSVNPVPEPSAALFVLAGAGVLGLVQYRRRQRSLLS